MGRGASRPVRSCAMHPVLAVVWHFWIAVLLVIPAILLVIGIGVHVPAQGRDAPVPEGLSPRPPAMNPDDLR